MGAVRGENGGAPGFNGGGGVGCRGSVCFPIVTMGNIGCGGGGEELIELISNLRCPTLGVRDASCSSECVIVSTSLGYEVDKHGECLE